MHGSGTVEPTGKNESLPTPHRAILAGDLNAFTPEDRTVPEGCDLHDAFLVLGGEEDTKEGFTWGQQVSELERERFGCSRMDKVLFCGGLRVIDLQRIGEGQKIWVEYPAESSEEDGEEGNADSETGKDLWVTDHLGLQADFEVVV